MNWITKQFGFQNVKYRLLRAGVVLGGAIVALGHVPGYDPVAGAWKHIADALFEWIGVGVALGGAMLTSEPRTNSGTDK